MSSVQTRTTCIRSERGAMLADGELADGASVEWLDPLYWRQRAAVSGRAGGRGSVLLVDRPGGRWVLRHYRRGGMVARLLGDRYLYTGIARVRAIREFRLLQQMRESGLPVPRPVAAGFRRRGVFYRADLLTVEIPGTETLARRVLDEDLGESDWRAVGRCIGGFHRAGIFHADLNAHNVLLDRRGDVYLVDFDRGGRRRSGAWRRQNIARLERSLRKLALESGRVFDEVGFAHLTAAYRASLTEGQA